MNSVDPDEMPLYVAFHLGLHCLQKYPILQRVNFVLEYVTITH